MSYFEFPHTRNYDGDLGYIIKKLDELNTRYNNFFDYNSIRFHDPINWSIETVYTAFEIVYDEQSEAFFISKTAVPAGIDINNDNYWTFLTPFKTDMTLNVNSVNPIANKPVAEKFNSVYGSIGELNSALTAEINARTAQSAELNNDISGLANALNTETTARSSADTAINARIDGIIALEPGSTTGDAELQDIRTWFNGKTSATAGDAVRGEVSLVNDKVDNLQKISEVVTYSTVSGVYVDSTDGAVRSNANYSTAQYNSNSKILIPAGCKRIIFNNAVFYASGVNGWAMHSAIAGTSTSTFIRGGQTQYVDIEAGDVAFAFSSYKISGTVPASLSVTFVYNIELFELDKEVTKAVDTCTETETKSNTAYRYVDYTDGSAHTFPTDRYGLAFDIIIPELCTRVEFYDTVFVSGSTAGWAVYNKAGSFIRGGQTKYINVVSGDYKIAITSAGLTSSDSAPATIDVNFVYRKINEKINELERRTDNVNHIANNNMKIVMLGDSIVGNFDGEGSIPVYLSEYTGATCYNCAFGGSSMGSDTTSPNQYLEPFNGWKIINAIISDDWDDMQDVIDSDPDHEHIKANYQAHLNTLKNMDWSTVDIISFSYGTNDWGTGVILDDPDNPKNTNTFTGAFRTALETLWTNYPAIKVIINGVIWRGLTISGDEIINDSDNGKHGRNWYLREYEDALETICGEYHIPFVPMYDHTNFNRYTWSAYFPANDATHPNPKGREVMAKRYAAHFVELTKR